MIIFTKQRGNWKQLILQSNSSGITWFIYVLLYEESSPFSALQMQMVAFSG